MVPATEESVNKLIAVFSDPMVGRASGRQLPHRDACLLASHARHFNYPNVSSIRDKECISTLGLKAAFCSNSFAAYRISALHDCGGFPLNVILGEDMYVAAKMLLRGYKTAYVANATVYHSHNYSPIEEFKRYFDTGVYHAREAELLSKFGSVSGEGVRFILSELSWVGWKIVYMFPAILLRSAMKLMGYKLGKLERYIPIVIKRKLSMHRGFWAGN